MKDIPLVSLHQLHTGYQAEVSQSFELQQSSSTRGTDNQYISQRYSSPLSARVLSCSEIPDVLSFVWCSFWHSEYNHRWYRLYATIINMRKAWLLINPSSLLIISSSFTNVSSPYLPTSRSMDLPLSDNLSQPLQNENPKIDPISSNKSTSSFLLQQISNGITHPIRNICRPVLGLCSDICNIHLTMVISRTGKFIYDYACPGLFLHCYFAMLSLLIS